MSVNELKASQIRINDGYWAKYQKLLGDVMLPKQWDFLNKVNGIDAFKAASGLKMPCVDKNVGAVHGTLDAGKLMEAIGYHLLHNDAPQWREAVDELVDAMDAAQLADGYLLPIKQMQGLNSRFTNLLTEHEIYRMGNMIEGLLSYYDATGSAKALRIAKKLGDCMCLHFGESPDQIRGYDGHPSVEIALMKLYRATGEKKYFNIQQFFINERGTTPNYFSIEYKLNQELRPRAMEDWGSDYRYWSDFAYFVANKPLRDMDEPIGHAVRACYLYAGAADLAYETRDEKLIAALKRIWNQMESNNVYITGGVGQHAHIEAFGKAYDLPPDDAYNETCASVALIFWAQRMFKLEPDIKYADMIERALYNGVMCGLSLDGTSYFYVNPLEVWPGNDYRKDKEHVKSQRQSWFDVACCPPSLARIIGEVAIYFYMTDGDRIYVNQYADTTAELTVNGMPVKIEQKTQYPFDGNVSLRVSAGNFKLMLRKPYWCTDFGFQINGKHIESEFLGGYAVIDRTWVDGDTITVTMGMEPRRVYANPLARHMDGCVALMYGPLIYCLEQADNFPNLRNVSLPDDAQLKVAFDKDLLEGTMVITADGWVDESMNAALYTFEKPSRSSVKLRFIPYYKWANREEGEMLVWIRRG